MNIVEIIMYLIINFALLFLCYKIGYWKGKNE